MSEIKLTSLWHRSVSDIDEKLWNKCFHGGNILQSYQLQKTVENAKLINTEYHYLVISDASGLVAIIPCFTKKVSITATASTNVKLWVSRVRKIWANFLYQKVFVLGTPVAICSDLLGIQSGLFDDDKVEVLKVIASETKIKAKQLKSNFVIVKEISSSNKNDLQRIWRDSFFFVESPATTYLVTGSKELGRYEDRLRGHYRRLMKIRREKLAKANFYWKRFDDFEQYAEKMWQLYLEVKKRSKVQFEELTPDFFKLVSKNLGEFSYALICFEQDEPVACELILRDKNWIHPIYIGMDYKKRDEGALYFNCLYKVIEEVESYQMNMVQLGQMSYQAKESIGAVVSRLYLAVAHTNPIVNRLLKYLSSALFPSTVLPNKQRVLKDKDKANQLIKDVGISISE